ncbi:hypothetical protein Ancab_002414 [Ancistrocladus abbreviatus]
MYRKRNLLAQGKWFLAITPYEHMYTTHHRGETGVVDESYMEDMFIWNADEDISGNPNSSEMYPKSLSFMAESMAKQKMIKTLFSPEASSQDGKSDRGSILEVMVTEKVPVTGKGSGGPADGGKQGSPSVEFVAGDGGNKCSINDDGQELSLAKLKDPHSGPNLTRFTTRQVESVGQSPETMGQSPASFKEGSDQVDKEVTPSSQRMPLKPTISPTQAVNNMEYGELGSTTDHNIAAAGFIERDLQEECRAVVEVE